LRVDTHLRAAEPDQFYFAFSQELKLRFDIGAEIAPDKAFFGIRKDFFNLNSAVGVDANICLEPGVKAAQGISAE